MMNLIVSVRIRKLMRRDIHVYTFFSIYEGEKNGERDSALHSRLSVQDLIK